MEKLSVLRNEILEIINKNIIPETAKKIKKKILKKPDITNVYRGLGFLEEKNMIHSISYSGVKYYYNSKSCGGHFLICKSCNEFIKFDDCNLSKIQSDIAKEYSYRIESHVVYFEGYCKTCD